MATLFAADTTPATGAAIADLQWALERQRDALAIERLRWGYGEIDAVDRIPETTDADLQDAHLKAEEIWNEVKVRNAEIERLKAEIMQRDAEIADFGSRTARMSLPLVSIVVPTYERAGFVETAVISLLEQDYPALEVLAIDDGSRDETSTILARIAERSAPDRFRWWQQENAGQAMTINRGLEQASGELLGYLSSDDYLLPGAISRLVEAFAAHPDADVAYADQLVVDDSDHVTDTVELISMTFEQTLRSGLCPVGVGALVRRRLYERIGGWDPSHHFYPDYEWWLRAGDVGFVRVAQPGGAWRIHGGSISTGNFAVENLRERLSERLLLLEPCTPEATCRPRQRPPNERLTQRC